MIEKENTKLLLEALESLVAGFDGLPDFQLRVDLGALENTLEAVAERMRDNYPYFHPFYLGQMLKPPHPVARLAYALAMYINPNNHALDGGRASSAMEKEAVAQLAAMFGWKTHLGHLTSGGTMANLEALWVAGRLNPGLKVVASDQAHYTHERICGVLQLPFEAVTCDQRARMDPAALERLLKQGGVGTVVATIGTTATGSVDPLPDILDLQKAHGFRLHADAAYGGFFTLAGNLAPEAAEAFERIGEVDSIVIDPHKHGLQPYGCGCVLFRDPAMGLLYKHDSPYTYFSSDELHLGEISLECSRPGASAVALWATQRMLPLDRRGRFAGDLDRCRLAAQTLFARIQNDPRFMAAMAPELDIVVWAPEADRASRVSFLSQAIFEAAAGEDLHLALANFPASLFCGYWPEVQWDQDQVICLRSCLMKPEHLEWIDRIWMVLDRVTDRVLGA